MRKLWLALPLLGCVLLAVFGCRVARNAPATDNSTAKRAAELEQLMPAELSASGRYKEVQRTVRIRVYADDDHRARVQDWAASFDQQLDLANQILISDLGIKLEVADHKPWSHSSQGDVDLPAALAALVALDSAKDVDLVFGLVSAPPAVTASVHASGMASTLGRHVVLRGFDMAAERAELAAKAVQVKESDADFPSLLAVRAEHRQAALVLHQIGHLLGALHVTAPATEVMNVSYSRTMTGFSPANLELMRAVLPAWTAPPSERSPAAEWRALAEHLERTPRWPGWVEAEHQELRAQASQSMAAHSQAEASQAKQGVPAEARDMYDRARIHLAQKRFDAALAEISPLIEAYPAHTELRRLACVIWVEKEGPGSQGAAVQCKRIGELDPTDYAGEIILAGAFVEAQQPVQAHEALVHLIARTPSLGKGQYEAFAAIFALYQRMNAVTWAEQAVAQAPPAIDTKDTRAWAVSTRRRYGLPPNSERFGITAEREGEYLGLVRTALDLVYGKKEAEARTLVQEGLKRFRNAPGLLGVQCDMELRAQRFAQARARCQKALAGYDEASWPRYLLGIVELRFRRNQDGIAHLEKAIAVDPDLKQAYHALHQAYGRQNNPEAQNRLRTGYFERFGVAIPER